MANSFPLSLEPLVASPPRAAGNGARVLLVSAYELGHQPIGLAAPAAALRAAGHDVRTLDVAVEVVEGRAFRDIDLLAISIPMHTAARIGLELAKSARRLNPDLHVAFYGLYAGPLRALLEAPGHSVIGGEYEPGLLALADGIAQGAGADREVEAGTSLARQRYPVPDRRGLPGLERYATVRRADGEFRAGYVEATRGCAHTCRHCPITPVYGGALRLVQRETVIADIEQQIARGARHITFGDPDFLNAVPHSLAIVEALHAQWAEVTYDATIKVEHLIEHEGVLPRLRDSGCIFITSAFESCNDAILATLEKGHTLADMDRALAISAREGLTVRPTWVAFTPWTALEDYLAILDFVERHGLQRHVQPVQYSLRLLLPPGSPLNRVLDEQGLLGPFDEEHLTYTWANPDPRVDALQAEVLRIVEAAAEQPCGCDDESCAPGVEDALATFERVREAAYAAAGRPLPERSGPQPPAVVPGLSEAWYCCAEPTSAQLTPLFLER